MKNGKIKRRDAVTVKRKCSKNGAILKGAGRKEERQRGTK